MTLSVDDWNIIIRALAERPYVEVAHLIPDVKAQAQQALSVDDAETKA